MTLTWTRTVLMMMLTLLPFTMAMAQKSPKRELRAAWIATVNNIDWPSKPGLPASQQREEYVLLLDSLAAAGMNAVVMQIRPTADTFYPSSYEPWSAYLTGKQGQAPSSYYNPLGSLSRFRQTPKGLMPNLTKGFSVFILLDNSSTK